MKIPRREWDRIYDLFDRGRGVTKNVLGQRYNVTSTAIAYVLEQVRKRRGHATLLLAEAGRDVPLRSAVLRELGVYVPTRQTSARKVNAKKKRKPASKTARRTSKSRSRRASARR